MNRIPLRTVVAFQPCGECQACCTVLGILELQKPTWTRCEHQCETGCDIYEHAPATCRGYSCLWQAGLIEGDEYRPDRFGLIFDLRHTGTGEIIQVWEVWPRAFEQSSVRELMTHLETRRPLALRRCPDGDYSGS